MSAERRPWAILDLETPPLRGPHARLAVLVGALGAVFLLLPRALGWAGDHLWAEDATVFLAQQDALGADAWFVTYGGYVHLVPRMLATAAAGLPLEAHPTAMLAFTIVFRLVAYGYAARLLAAYLGSPGWGIAAAAIGVLFLPAGQWEVMGNITNLRWTLDVLVVVLLMSVFPRPAAACWAGLLLLGAAMSDPLALGMAPLVVLRLVARRGWARLPAIAFTAGALGQALLMEGATRTIPEGDSFLHHPDALGIQLAVRGPLSTQFGISWTSDLARGEEHWVWAALVVTLAVMVAALAARRVGRVARASRIAFLVVWAGAGLALFLATMTFVAMSMVPVDPWWRIPISGPRYTALVCFFLTPVLVAGWQALWTWGGPARVARILAAASMAILMVGVVRDFAGYPTQYDTPSWRAQVAAARARCATDGSPSRLAVSPQWWGGLERACDGALTVWRQDH